MATMQYVPEPDVAADYETWFADVRVTLAMLQMEIDTWDQNWPYDFQADFAASMSPEDAASRAQDFWWHHLMEESWT